MNRMIVLITVAVAAVLIVGCHDLAAVPGLEQPEAANRESPNGGGTFAYTVSAKVNGPLALVPQITAVNGYTPPGLGWVVNGRLTPSYNPGGSQKIVGRFCVDVNPTGWYMELVGSNFGSSQGSVSFSDPAVTLRPNSLSWNPTTIRFTPQYATACPNGPIDNFRITIRRTDGQTASVRCSVAQSVQTRPLCQCTWWAATSRMGRGRSIPMPKAYSWNNVIDGRFRPASSDVVLWYTTSSPNVDYGKHTAFIESVSRSVSRPNPPTYRITYTLQLSQYNADRQESWSPYNTQFVVDSVPGSPPTQTVIQGIKFSGNSSAALAVWR